MTITRTAVLEALKEIVTEVGEDFVYDRQGRQNCRYSVDGKPSCIAGKAIAKLDPEAFQSLVKWEESHDGASFTINNWPRSIEPLDAEPAALKALATAQGVQDRSNPYGRALAAAERGTY